MQKSPSAHLLFCFAIAVVASLAPGCNHSSPGAPSTTTGAPATSPAAATPGHTLTGTITEPNGTPISGVSVTTRPNPSGGPSRTGTAITDEEGHYEMDHVAGCLWVKVAREGYEGGEWINCVNLDRNQVFDTTMQQVERIDAGAALDDRVLANDMDWAIDVLDDVDCGPCKIVRIVAPETGTLSVSVTWPGPPNAISLWSPGFPPTHFTGANALVGTVQVSSNREVMLYVAWDTTAEGANEQPFHLESTLLVPGETVAAMGVPTVPSSPGSALRNEHVNVRSRHLMTTGSAGQR